MPQLSTDSSSILYHSPLLACNESYPSLKRNCRFSPQLQRERAAEQRVHQNKSRSALKETFSLSKALDTCNTDKEIFFPSTHYSIKREIALYLCVTEEVSVKTGVTTVHHKSI